MSSFLINPYRFKGPGNATFGGISNEFYSAGSFVSSFSVTLSNVAAGDLVLVLAGRYGQPDITGVTVGGNAATFLKRHNTNDDGANSYRVDVWGIIAPSSNSSATVTATYSTSNHYGALIAARWSGVSSATSLVSSCSIGTVEGVQCLGRITSSDKKSESVTTSERALIIATGLDYSGPTTHTAQSGWTKRIDGATGAVSSGLYLHSRVSDAGTYGGATAFATTTTDDYVAMMLAFPLL
jgi:hypothetical protein